MVARISTGANPRGAVYYNEEKVEQGQAQRLALRNYAGIMVDPLQAGRQQVAYLLEERAALNGRVTKPTFHVSLSLAPGEKPSSDELLSLADMYMIGMGFGRQPYAVYQHFDTDHTHVHIVSVRVDEKGKRISDTFEREKSNKLRQQLEKEFGLVEAEKVAHKPVLSALKPVHYGQGDLKQSVTNVVLTILSEYRFSSLAQFNQLLGLYNVKAVELPLEGKKPGLVYTVANGKDRQGGGFKASTLRQQPTFDMVERRINSGKKAKGDGAPRMRKILQEQLKSATSWTQWHQRLGGMNVAIVGHQSQDGDLLGISFIDGKQKAIYSGGELGKEFTAESLKSKLGETFDSGPKDGVQANHHATQVGLGQNSKEHQQPEVESNKTLTSNLLYTISQVDDQHESEQELKKMTRKKGPRL